MRKKINEFELCPKCKADLCHITIGKEDVFGCPKCKKELSRKKSEKLVIVQPKIKGCSDSFFYEGIIAEKGKHILCANGEIRIYKDNEMIYDGKERNNGFGFKVINDKDLMKVSGDNGFTWDMNNWFEVYSESTDIGEVLDTYEEALDYLRLL